MKRGRSVMCTVKPLKVAMIRNGQAARRKEGLQGESGEASMVARAQQASLISQRLIQYTTSLDSP